MHPLLRLWTTLVLVAALALLPTSVAEHPQSEGDKQVSFDHKTGNEWWVEVILGGASAPEVSSVRAQDTDGPWVALEKKDWGAWGASFHIEPGHDIRFQAVWSDGTQVTSCWFSHPEGVEACTRDADRPATYIGGDGGERGTDVAIGADGDVHVAGSTSFPDFHAHGARLSGDLTDLRWQRSFGGESRDLAQGVAVAPDGGTFLVGVTRSEDFPTTPGAYDTTWRDKVDGEGFQGFVARLDALGATEWVTLLGGSSYDEVTAVEVDAAGRPVVSGTTQSCDFPATAGAYSSTSTDCEDAFVARLSADGSTLEAATFFGGGGRDTGADLAMAPDGDILLYGTTASQDLPTTDGAYARAKPGPDGDDVFVARLDASLETLVAASYLGAPGDKLFAAGGIAVDAQGAAYVTGSTASTAWPTTSGAWQTSMQSPSGCPDDQTRFEGACLDGYLTKFTPGLDALAYSTYIGGEGKDHAADVAVDDDGQAHVAGSTNSHALVAPANGQDHGFRDGFHLLVSADGSELRDASAIGGDNWDEATAVAWRDGTAHVTGFTGSEDFATSDDAHDRTLGGNTDMFLVRVATTPSGVVFDHRAGNEWWVQVHVDGAMPSRVQAMDTGDPWHELTLRDWGDWAASFHIEPGHDVRFRAMVDGAWQTSCWFSHPGGKTLDGGETCGAGDAPPPPSDFDASFRTPGGNEWWVEVYVDADEAVVGVDARDDGGAWIALEKRSWGAWARSFHVADGSLVQFRAHSVDGGTDLSGEYRWPEGEQVSSGA